MLGYKFSASLIAKPLVLSAFTQLWNEAEFPELHPDESDYLRKSIHNLEGFGPQETTNHPIANLDHPYTHP